MIQFFSKLSSTRLFSFLILAVICSCDYEPGKQFYKQVAQPDASGVTINLNASDTVLVYQGVQYSYMTTIGNRKIHQISVYFDNKLITTLSSPSSTFYLSPDGYSDGAHSLMLEMLTSTGSGSLADVVGAEQIKVSRSWVAYIDRSTPQPVPLTNIEIENGTLKVQWSRYAQHNFKAYEIIKYCYNTHLNEYYSCFYYEVADQNTTSLEDLTYMGGNVRFEIYVKSYFQNSSRTQKDFSFNYDPALRYEWTDKQHVKLTWRKAPLYKNFYAYSIQHLDLGDYTPTLLTSINDTTTTVPLANKFGSAAGVILSVQPGGGSVFGVESIQNVPIGDYFPSFLNNNIVYNKSTNKYFAIQYVDQYRSTLMRIDGTTFHVEAKLTIGRILPFKSIALSENGQYLYVSVQDTIKEINQQTLTTISNNYLVGFNTITVSNTNLIATCSGGGKLIRMPGFTVIQTSVATDMAISPSGNYLNADKKIWKWNGSSFDFLTGNLQTDLYSPVFENDQKLLLINSRTIDVFDVAAQGFLTQIPIEWYTDVTVFYDPVSGLIGRLLSADYNSGTYYLYNSTSSQPIQAISVGRNDVSTGIYDLILNNNLICSNGTIVPLSYFQ